MTREPLSPTAINDANPISATAGIGLRFQHHQAVVESKPDVAWMEIHTENYMGGGTPLRYLDTVRRDYPISLHGVGLSLGSADGLDLAHLERIRQVAERIEPVLMSEHIAWSVVGGTYLADLLPLPGSDIPVPRALSANGRLAFKDYLAGALHKAFAMSPRGPFGWVVGRRTIEEAQASALENCKKYADDCRVIVADDAALK